ncbi:DUF5683 domain-containing protein [Mucilaginibacter sp. PPCGB 2223]|uniref:DUF5683 domain-containing protein n=1 Tax=Mucilaginibacter sp. PPCGB 2223 TaxID=1886027 RepID=UPI001111ADCA|nr:DUF5683 domain-containing protein [Mucilaginibacter sp. PPCGB 2223]
MKRYLLIVVLLFAVSVLKAQTPDTTRRRNKTDSLNLKRDAAKEKPFFTPGVKPKKKEPVYHPDSTHSPRKAAMRSLYFPGLGQIYNRHGLWWRLPALYGGLGALAYNIYTNGKDYNAFLKESQWRAHGRPVTEQEPLPVYNGSIITNISDQTIYNFKDNLRRNRDLSIFGFVAVWGINIVDAYVEAKFMHSYTMDDNLSFKISPSIMGTPVYASNFNSTFTPALKITLLFK